MPRIFVSYRREDAAGHAGRLFDRLRARFGEESVFMDVSGIEPGVDFVEAIDREVGSCDVLLAVIGREWLGCRDAGGRRRLEDPNDFIRIEVARALARGVRVVPVLVEGATMPPADALPSDLQPLARRHAVELRDTRWDADVEDLIDRLERTLDGRTAGPPGLPGPPPRRSQWPWIVGVSAITLGVVAFLTWKAAPFRGHETPPTAAPTAGPGVREEEGFVKGRLGQDVTNRPPVRMPTLVGRPLVEARKILAPAGIEPMVTFEATRKEPPDTVLRQFPPAEAEIPEDLRMVELTVSREPGPEPPGPTLSIHFSEEADGPAAQELADFLRRSDVPVSSVNRNRRALSAPGALLYSNEEHRELAERIAVGSRDFLSRLYGHRVPIEVRHDPRVVRGALILNLPAREPGGL